MTAQEKYDRIKAIMRDTTASDEKSLRGLEDFLEKKPSRNLTPYHKQETAAKTSANLPLERLEINSKEKIMSDELEYDFDDPTRGLAGDWALEDTLEKRQEKEMQTEEYRERERAFHAERNREDQFRETATLAEWEEYNRKKNGLPITSENPPLERLNKNNREQSMENERTEAARLASMSDEELKQESREAESARDREARLDGTNEREEAVGQTTGFDQKKASMEAAAYQRTVISGAIKKGELACLPGADGYADTTPAVKLTSGQNFHGTDLLYLKNHTKENAFPTAEYVSYAEIKDAQQDKKDLIIREGQKGVSIHSESFNKETNEWEKTHTRWFNVAQLNKPAVMKEWAAEKQMEKYQEYVAYKKTQHGDNWKPDPPKQKQAGHDVVCSSTEPKEYLGQYLAAVSMGSKFSATPEQAAEFSQKMQDTMWAKTLTSPKTGEPVTNPFALAKISNEANKYCKEFIQQAKIEARKQEQPEQKLAQSRGRGM